MKRLCSLILVLCFLLSLLTGCGESSTLIRYDISHTVGNLDPQFATAETDQMVIHNLFEGLVRQLPDGSIEAALAEDWSISEDELTYTFHLRQDAQWHNGQPVTAHDFVFAFRRIFNALSPSPYAQHYLFLQGARSILENNTNAANLGVRAKEDYTLEFHLAQADSSFLEKLCHSSAMPCNEEFFNETRGKYGSTLIATASCGPFFLNLWDSEKLYIKKSSSYYDAGNVLTPGVYLWIDRENRGEEGETITLYDLVLDGKSDSCAVTYQQAEDAKALGYSCQEHIGTVWGLVANPQHHQLSNENIRRSFFHSVNPEELEGYLIENMVLCDRLISPEISLFTELYTDSTETDSDIYEPELAREEWQAGLTEIGSLALDSMELLVPQDGDAPFLCGMLQQMWQRNLSAFVNIVSLPADELEQRVAAGDYDLAIVPFTSSSNSPYDVLSRFHSESALNVWNYNSEDFDRLLDQASSSSDEDFSRRNYEQAEELLYSDCIVFPMFYEISYILFAPDVTGIEIYPYGGMVLFKDAVAMR